MHQLCDSIKSDVDSVYSEALNVGGGPFDADAQFRYQYYLHNKCGQSQQSCSHAAHCKAVLQNAKGSNHKLCFLHLTGIPILYYTILFVASVLIASVTNIMFTTGMHQHSTPQLAC
jgi:hypothetical protein